MCVMRLFLKCFADITTLYKGQGETSNHLRRTNIKGFSIYQTVNSNFRAFWLAPVTRNFLGLIYCFATRAKMASRFQTFSEEEIWAINEAVVHNKYQESDELWLAGVYWWVENYLHDEFVTLNRKNALDKSPIEMIVLANKVLTY